MRSFHEHCVKGSLQRNIHLEKRSETEIDVSPLTSLQPARHGVSFSEHHREYEQGKLSPAIWSVWIFARSPSVTDTLHLLQSIRAITSPHYRNFFGITTRRRNNVACGHMFCMERLAYLATAEAVTSVDSAVVRRPNLQKQPKTIATSVLHVP